MKIVIINGSARKGNTLTAINAFIKGASEKNEIEIIEPDKLNIAPVSYTHLVRTSSFLPYSRLCRS